MFTWNSSAVTSPQRTVTKMSRRPIMAVKKMYLFNFMDPALDQMSGTADYSHSITEQSTVNSRSNGSTNNKDFNLKGFSLMIISFITIFHSSIYNTKIQRYHRSAAISFSAEIAHCNVLLIIADFPFTEETYNCFHQR